MDKRYGLLPLLADRSPFVVPVRTSLEVIMSTSRNFLPITAWGLHLGLSLPGLP